MGREFELKYQATREQLAAITEDFAPFDSIAMETTYYDTPERALGRLRWTLRRRLENGISVCTVKTPEAGGARGEWETRCGDILSAIPTLCALGAPKELEVLTAQGIREVCAARFTRQAAQVTTRDCTLELALDQGVLLGGGKTLPFTEVEVELKSGSEEAAIAFANALARQYGLTAEPASKYKRALSLTLY